MSHGQDIVHIHAVWCSKNDDLVFKYYGWYCWFIHTV